MSNIFFVSDSHYFHTNIIKYSNRPFVDVEDMNEQMIKNWNAVVKPGDTVYNLGDFSFGKIENTVKILKRLNGNHNYIFGNHCKELIRNKEILLSDGYFKSMDYYKQIRVGGQHINLFHFGCRVWDRSHHGSWLLFGHSHGILTPHGKSVDVGVDAPFVTGKPEYRPISFEEVKRFMDKQEVTYVDHHEDR
jgi:calcineurin-like phosphoesterase family protein